MYECYRGADTPADTIQRSLEVVYYIHLYTRSAYNRSTANPKFENSLNLRGIKGSSMIPHMAQELSGEPVANFYQRDKQVLTLKLDKI